MFKQVVFNVGGALSTYFEVAGKKVIVDLGSSKEFNPIVDFLLPLYEARNSDKRSDGRYTIDQCIISHPHNDHLSAIVDFNKYFYPELLTCPNNNLGMTDSEKINWELIPDAKGDAVVTLRKMLEGRTPPLRPIDTTTIFINYLPAKNVENDSDLVKESYPNNVSIATYVKSEGLHVLMPGDVQKLGMKNLLRRSSFRRKVEEGVDVLIAPHHGLRSSFSTDLFSYMPDKKVRCLTVVPEKESHEDDEDGRIVDPRYCTDEYCKGENVLSTDAEKHYQVKTSRGHVYFSSSWTDRLNVEILSDIRDVIKKFV